MRNRFILFISLYTLTIISGRSLTLSANEIISPCGTTFSGNGESKYVTFASGIDVESLVRRLRENQRRIVFTNGCFDILHIGHIRYLREARTHGDVLIVAINSDRSVMKIKGKGRPIIPENERAEMLLAYSFVDFVIIYDDETPIPLLKIIHPDILVKGADYPIEGIVGGPFVQSYGGTVFPIGVEEVVSTTEIIRRIRALPDEHQ